MSRRLYLGGRPGLRPGDLFEPHHRRRRRAGLRDSDRVFATPDRHYAKHFASLWRPGDLYQVVPVGEWKPSAADPIESFHAPAARVTAVLDRSVLLTEAERRHVSRQWHPANGYPVGLDGAA
ncbi:hypothetical protein ACIP5Y_21225 [Nocardia sp. NPDC088792]|uniref:hypothetical protein n=1 Tax=Nocardia sp. NPDC088792 TaxID=3364332 RepID=UPI00381C7489